jgi:hypothetical protein
MDPASSLREEPTIAELIEARERTDAGLRLAMPMFMDGLGPDPEPGRTEHLPIAEAPMTVVTDEGPEVDEELIGRVADRAAEFRHEAFRELRHLDKRAPRRVHIRALALVAECDEFLAAVGEHFRGQS